VSHTVFASQNQLQLLVFATVMASVNFCEIRNIILQFLLNDVFVVNKQENQSM